MMRLYFSIATFGARFLRYLAFENSPPKYAACGDLDALFGIAPSPVFAIPRGFAPSFESANRAMRLSDIRVCLPMARSAKPIDLKWF